jgi:hypothetical protein
MITKTALAGNRAACAIRIMLERRLEVERAVGEVGVEQWKNMSRCFNGGCFASESSSASPRARASECLLKFGGSLYVTHS